MDNRSGKMFLGGVRAGELVERFGSPLFVMEEDRIRENVRRVKDAFSHPATRIFYAVKANPNLRVLELMRELGIGADCCSAGEAHLARKAGFPAGDISFTGTALTDSEAHELAEALVPSNVDALSQLDRYLPLFPAGLGIRVNPGRGTGLHQSCTTGGKESKLGIPIDLAPRALEIAKKHGRKIVGLHVHTGSGGLDVEHFRAVARAMFELAETFAGDLRYVDLGGGLGVPHAPEDPLFDLAGYASEACALLDRWNSKHATPIQLYVEPGQYLVSDAGWLLLKVVIRKETPYDRTFLITDSNFNHYLGTALYQSYHEFLKCEELSAPASEEIELCGNLCNTGDTFARGRRMPRLVEGDLLAMVNAGAYGLSRASNYNSRPIPAEVMVRDGRARLIRRRQTYDDLLLWQE